MPDILTRGDNCTCWHNKYRETIYVEDACPLHGKVKTDGIDSNLGYDPIQHEKNMQWLKEQQGRRKGVTAPTDESALIRPQAEGGVSEAVSEGENQSSAKPEPVVAAPETITISLPALRATILAALDDKTWLLYEQIHKGHILWSEDKANEERLRFCDEIERRLRQLPAQG